MIGRRGFFKLLGAAAAGAMIPLPAIPLSASTFEYTNLSVPMTWGPGPSPDKLAFIQAMLKNAIEAHDNMIEEALFSSHEGSHDIRGLQSGLERACGTPAEAYRDDDSGDDDAGFW